MKVQWLVVHIATVPDHAFWAHHCLQLFYYQLLAASQRQDFCKLQIWQYKMAFFNEIESRCGTKYCWILMMSIVGVRSKDQHDFSTSAIKPFKIKGSHLSHLISKFPIRNNFMSRLCMLPLIRSQEIYSSLDSSIADPFQFGKAEQRHQCLVEGESFDIAKKIISQRQ